MTKGRSGPNKKPGPKGPSKMTPETLAKMEEGFMMGFTDEEACLWANVSTCAFYTWLKKNESYKKRKEVLKKSPNMKAKDNWVKQISAGSYQASKEWLERRAKDEFSLKHEIDQKSTVDLNVNVGDLNDDELDKIINGE